MSTQQPRKRVTVSALKKALNKGAFKAFLTESKEIFLMADPLRCPIASFLSSLGFDCFVGETTIETRCSSDSQDGPIVILTPPWVTAFIIRFDWLYTVSDPRCSRERSAEEALACL